MFSMDVKNLQVVVVCPGGTGNTPLDQVAPQFIWEAIAECLHILEKHNNVASQIFAKYVVMYVNNLPIIDNTLVGDFSQLAENVLTRLPINIYPQPLGANGEAQHMDTCPIPDDVAHTEAGAWDIVKQMFGARRGELGRNFLAAGGAQGLLGHLRPSDYRMMPPGQRWIQSPNYPPVPIATLQHFLSVGDLHRINNFGIMRITKQRLVNAGIAPVHPLLNNARDVKVIDPWFVAEKGRVLLCGWVPVNTLRAVVPPGGADEAVNLETDEERAAREAAEQIQGNVRIAARQGGDQAEGVARGSGEHYNENGLSVVVGVDATVDDIGDWLKGNNVRVFGTITPLGVNRVAGAEFCIVSDYEDIPDAAKAHLHAVFLRDVECGGETIESIFDLGASFYNLKAVSDQVTLARRLVWTKLESIFQSTSRIVR